MEASMSNTTFRYVLIFKEKVPVLFVYFNVLTLSTRNFRSGENKSYLKGVLNFFLQLKKAKVLILGNALRIDTLSYCFDPQKINKEEAIAAIAGVAEKIGSDECVTAVILKDLAEPRYKEQKMLADMGYSAPWNDQVMDLEIASEWSTIDDYVSRLSRKYKTRANKIIASGNALTQKILTAEEVTGYEPLIKKLYATLVDKQSFTLTTTGADNIAALKQLYGDAFEVTGFFFDGQLVAFSTAFVTGNAYELYYVGFDYDLNNQYQLYFNLLFSGLSRAITLKKQLLKLGRTSFDAKASLGAKARETGYLIKISNVPDVVIKWFASYFSSLEDAKWKLRSPLKAETPVV
jgi:hypothetical protein